MSVRMVPGAASFAAAVVGTAALATAVLGATAVVLAAPAHAHNVLAATVPAAGATVPTAPAAVTLEFDQKVLGLGTAVKVTGPDGEVQEGKASVVDNRVVQPLAPGAPKGEYTVAWRVTSVDGHPISDTFTFTAQAPSTATAPPAGAATPTATPVAATDDSGEETPWATIVLGGVLGTAAGTAYVIYQRRRKARADGTDEQP